MSARLKKRVLLVDDDEQVLEGTQAALEAHGYEVLIANDGTEGLIRAERDAPDLIILDVLMPRRSGFGVLEKLCCTPNRGPRIIVTTANDEPKYREFAKSKGADAFLRKPYDMEELLATMATLLGTSKSASS